MAFRVIWQQRLKFIPTGVSWWGGTLALNRGAGALSGRGPPVAHPKALYFHDCLLAGDLDRNGINAHWPTFREVNGLSAEEGIL